jgi:serine/threonine protein phosphatase PrpC
MSLMQRLVGWRRPAVVGKMTPSDATAAATWSVQSVSRSHVGRVRKINEDRLLDCATRGLWAVADGMGGHAAGDVAAEAVVSALRALTEASAAIDATAIEAVLAYTSRRLHARTGGDATRVSGSTVVALHLRDRAGTLLWAGDSRAYRLRYGVLTRLSHDHSFVQELIDAGALAPELAERHPKAHVVTRALGATSDIAIDARAVEVRPGDLYLLCSDGLSRSGDPDLAGLVGRPIDGIADTLLDRALADGGQDNISLVLIGIGLAGPGTTAGTGWRSVL